ncbi:hypothetical protein [Haladaptatus sp. DFWS20]|uniref:hypothetical protein n=1 Tax=Haladaptatus sp. DFWS20 TaxID=3403467 RepID=UPI003EC0E537
MAVASTSGTFSIRRTLTPVSGMVGSLSFVLDVSCEDIDQLLSESGGREASTIRMRREGLDSDGDNETVLKFNTRELELMSDDEYLVLKAETGSNCRLSGIDSVRVVGKSYNLN